MEKGKASFHLGKAEGEDCCFPFSKGRKEAHLSWPETEATNWVVSTQTKKRGKIRRRLKEAVLETEYLRAVPMLID